MITDLQGAEVLLSYDGKNANVRFKGTEALTLLLQNTPADYMEFLVTEFVAFLMKSKASPVSARSRAMFEALKKGGQPS